MPRCWTRSFQDPRAYYFRGLTYLQLGRPQEAAQDFKIGATLESRDFNKFYNVAKSLERVQGAARLALENYRVNARMAWLNEVERMRKARYEAIRRDEERVLRDQTVIPAPAPDSTKGPADANVSEQAVEKPATPATEQPAVTPAKPETPAAPEKKPEPENPFAS